LKPDEIKRLYDAGYAARYDEKFLLSPVLWPDTSYELELLGRLLESAASWLDVACGTGYFFHAFPQVARTGIDLSPAMLEIAKAANPGVELIEQNYLDDRRDWVGKFDLVSCMWYAYSFVESIAQLLQLIKNLSAWTSSGGTCFVPIADPALLTGHPLPYRLNNPFRQSDAGFAGDITLTGIMWNFFEEDGKKVHRNLMAPHPEFMIESFERYFEDVTLIRYPARFEGWTGRPAIVARRKRAAEAETA
jgi:SAM-dependent methyltransferase